MKINSKRKGKVGELELAKELNRLFPKLQCRRGQQFKGAADSPDICGLENWGIYPECKRVEKGLNLHDTLKKADSEKAEDQVSVVFHRKNRQDWQVTVALEDLAALAQSVISFS